MGARAAQVRPLSAPADPGWGQRERGWMGGCERDGAVRERATYSTRRRRPGGGVRGACLMTSAWIRYEDRALCGSGHVCITALMYGCGEIRSNVVVLAMPVVKLS